jgi:hypothetical protein
MPAGRVKVKNKRLSATEKRPYVARLHFITGSRAVTASQKTKSMQGYKR